MSQDALAPVLAANNEVEQQSATSSQDAKMEKDHKFASEEHAQLLLHTDHVIETSSEDKPQSTLAVDEAESKECPTQTSNSDVTETTKSQASVADPLSASGDVCATTKRRESPESQLEEHEVLSPKRSKKDD